MEVDLRGLRVNWDGLLVGFAVDCGDQVRAHYPENLRNVAAQIERSECTLVPAQH